MRQVKKVSLAICIASVLGATGHTAQASGFAVPEISILGLGTSNAVVANTKDLGAIPYNPAAAAFHPGATLTGGLMLVAPSLEVTTASGNHESQGEDVIPIPMLQGTYAISDVITLGLGINAPLGLETEWETTTFPGFAAVGAAAGHPTSSKIELVDISPTLAFRIGPHTAIAAGLDYYYVKTVEFSAAGLASEGDGDGWGWNASLIHEQGPWGFGLAYRSQVDADIEGSSRILLGGSAGLVSPATAEIPLPWRAQAGVRYQATDQLAVEFDITRTGWSSFDTLVINNGFGGVTSTNNWKDANAYRLGGTYMLTPRTQLRFGYTYDKTPQPRGFFSARIPDNDRHLFSVGLGHDLGSGLSIEGGYMYVQFEDYTHASTAIGLEPNGTLLYNGEYESSVHLFGVGLAKQF